MKFTKEEVVNIYNQYKSYIVSINQSQQDYLEFEEFLNEIIKQITIEKFKEI